MAADHTNGGAQMRLVNRIRPTVELPDDLDIARAHQKVQRVAVLGKSASVQLRTFSGPSAQGGSPVGGGR